MIRYPYTGEGSQGFHHVKGSYPDAFLLGLWRSMLRLRIIEEEIEKQYHKDEMKSPIHLVIGHEAANVGACAALRPTDHVWTSHRTHGVYLAKGGDLKAMMAELFCRTTGCVASRGGSMHLLDKKVGVAGGSALVAGSVPVATGDALAAQLKKLDRVSVSFAGDASLEEGAYWEAVNFAALRKLPIVYFCENNFYSVCSPLWKRQPEGVDLCRKAAGFCVETIKVDGTNVLLVHEAMVEAVERARGGAGPTFVEAQVGRWRAHGGAGDDSASGYRDPAEVAAWERFCPIAIYEAWLERRGVLTADAKRAARDEILRECEDAFRFARESPQPGPAELLKHVYAD